MQVPTMSLLKVCVTRPSRRHANWAASYCQLTLSFKCHLLQTGMSQSSSISRCCSVISITIPWNTTSPWGVLSSTCKETSPWRVHFPAHVKRPVQGREVSQRLLNEELMLCILFLQCRFGAQWNFHCHWYGNSAGNLLVLTCYPST